MRPQREHAPATITSGTPIQVTSSVTVVRGGFERSASRPAAIPDREEEDQEADQGREEDDDRRASTKKTASTRSRDGRGLLREEREVPHGRVRSPFGAERSGSGRRTGRERPASTVATDHHEHERRRGPSAVATPRTRTQSHDREGVLARRRVVVEADQQQPGRSASRSCPSDASISAELQVLAPGSRCRRSSGRSGRRASGSRAGGVGVVLRLRVVGVAEPDRVGQRVDRRLVAGQEVPARLGARAVVALEVAPLLRRGQLGRLVGAMLTVTTSNSLPTSSDERP